MNKINDDIECMDKDENCNGLVFYRQELMGYKICPQCDYHRTAFFKECIEALKRKDE